MPVTIVRAQPGDVAPRWRGAKAARRGYLETLRAGRADETVRLHLPSGWGSTRALRVAPASVREADTDLDVQIVVAHTGSSGDRRQMRHLARHLAEAPSSLSPQPQGYPLEEPQAGTYAEPRGSRAAAPRPTPGPPPGHSPAQRDDTTGRPAPQQTQSQFDYRSRPSIKPPPRPAPRPPCFPRGGPVAWEPDAAHTGPAPSDGPDGSPTGPDWSTLPDDAATLLAPEGEPSAQQADTPADQADWTQFGTPPTADAFGELGVQAARAEPAAHTPRPATSPAPASAHGDGAQALARSVDPPRAPAAPAGPARRSAPQWSATRAPAHLAAVVENLDEPFATTLLRLVDTKQLTDVQVYRRANLDRRLFSKIRSNPGYMPSKRTALALAVGLGLDLDETRALLARAGYTLSSALTCDVIVEHFISNGTYDVLAINEALFYFDQPLLGG
ncbi:MAG: hypothetical protein FWE61_04080 [Micrococcales bacterium]|nr:hypothetical protein [Micrococcales bacterium]